MENGHHGLTPDEQDIIADNEHLTGEADPWASVAAEAGHFHPQNAEQSEAPDVNTELADAMTDKYRQELVDDPNFAIKPGEIDAKTEKFNRIVTEDLSKLTSIEGILDSGLTTSEIIERFELMDFTGKAIFSDIDGTITDNEGGLNQEAVSIIKAFMEAGGTFIPVTGRARYESVSKLVDALGVPYIIINNGAEIYDNKGNLIYGSEIPDDQLKATFDAVNAKDDAVWMQNKRDPQTGEEWLYTNGTAETDQAMIDVGIVDNVHNEEGRIGLKAKHVDSAEVMAIPGQNYKIQIMSPNPDTIQELHDHFQSLGIPCMLNMQSKLDGKPHWVEVIVGTKISGIQKLINDFLPQDITSAAVVGDGGNDLTMFKPIYNRQGEQIMNRRTAVANASPIVKEAVAAAHQEGLDQKAAGEAFVTDGKELDARYDRLVIKATEKEPAHVISGGGAAIASMIFSLGAQEAGRRLADRYNIHANNPHRNPDFKKIIDHEAVQRAIEEGQADQTEENVA